MAAKKVRKLFKVAKELNLATPTLTKELEASGYIVTKAQMTPINDAMYEELLKKFAPERWANMQEELANKESHEQKRQTQKARQDDLDKILSKGEAEAESAGKPAPIVRQLDPKSLIQPDSIETAKKKIRDKKIEDSKKEASSEAVAKVTEEEDSKSSKPRKRPRKRKDITVREAAKALPVEAPSPSTVSETEAPEANEGSARKPAALSVRGAVSNEDILVYTPAAPVREEVVEDSEDEKKTESDGDETSKKKKRKRKRKRKTAQAETENQNKPVSKAKEQKNWPDDKAGTNTKFKKKRDRKKKKKVDVKEVQASIKQTMAAMDDHGKKKKRRRLERDVGIVDEEINLIKVTEFISTTELASLIDVPVNDLIRECLMLGLRVTINQRLERDTIQLLAEEHDYQVEFVDQVEEELFDEESDYVEDQSLMEERAPVVTVMGHVDHGKTSLLDYIRSTNIVSGEAGGITQHIGAYEITHSDKKITFLDTPGHAAFTAMRARGAQVTDIVVLIVAADDQVMPQTIEAIDHSKAAGVPIVVAINKMDKPGANPDKVRRQLSEHNVIVEEYGGDVLSSEISAKSGEGIPELLDKILLTSEMMELQANPKAPAKAVVIESRLEKGRGTVCSVLVERGTIYVGDVFVAGPYYGRVRAMYNERGQKRTEAKPAQPIEITGFEAAPHVGDHLIVYKSESEAKEIASKRQLQLREQEMRLREGFKGALLQTIAGQDKQELRLIIKGDVDGSVEAIADSLMRLSTSEVEANIISRSVGPINESDVLLASASSALIIGFNVHPNLKAREMAQREGVVHNTYRIIYELIEDVKKMLTGMYRREFKQEVVGTAEVRNTFKISRVGLIVGCMVIGGKIEKQNKIRILRDGTEIYSGDLDSLKRFKDDAKEVLSGFECGIKVAGYNDLKVGDIIESLVDVEVEREIEMEA